MKKIVLFFALSCPCFIFSMKRKLKFDYVSERLYYVPLRNQVIYSSVENELRKKIWEQKLKFLVNQTFKRPHYLSPNGEFQKPRFIFFNEKEGSDSLMKFQCD